MRPVKSSTAGNVPGVIDTMTAGFDQINRIPWIVGLPILMDLFLWLAPHLSAGPVLHRLVAQLGGLYDSVATSGADATTADQARQALQTFDAAASSFDLMSLLVVNLAGVPSILPPPLPGSQSIVVDSGLTLAAIVIAMELIGIFLGCVYLGAVAQQVRDGKVGFGRLGRRVWFYWLSVLGFIGLAVGLCAAASIPIGLAIGLAQLAAPGLATLLWALVVAVGNVALVLFLIYLFFLLDAIVISEAGPIRAAVTSARVVANSFWQTVGFIGIVYLISLGMQQVWMAMSVSPIGTAIAIAANAYIASGLAAASMLYYQTRAARLPNPRGVVGRVPQA